DLRRKTDPRGLSFLGHTTDSLWSVDLFRCESIVLRTCWVLVVMDQFTRRLVGIGVHCGTVTGADVCRMLNTATMIVAHRSTDHDLLFEAHRWRANLANSSQQELLKRRPRMRRVKERGLRESWSVHEPSHQHLLL